MENSRIMNAEEMEQVRAQIRDFLGLAIGDEYAEHISNNNEFLYAVCEDIELTSGWETENIFGDADVRLALGRVLCDYIGIDY